MLRMCVWLVSRGAESWWGCSDSDSNCDLWFDKKSKINDTLIIERVSSVQERKKKRDIS